MKYLIGAVFIILFANPGFAQAPASDRLQPSCGNRKIQFEVQTSNTRPDTNIEPGKAQVYVVEISEKAFSWDTRKITIRVGVDGEWVGAVKGNRVYLSLSVEPGEHHICAERQSFQKSMTQEAGFSSFTAEPGKRYYFRIRFAEHSGVDLERIDQDEGQFLLSSCRIATARRKK